MSNLWFFRLRRDEHQRRRSSGEQSTGSHSVYSAASLPLNVSRSPSFATNDCSWTEEESIEELQQQEEQHQQQHQEAGRSAPRARRSSSGSISSSNQQAQDTIPASSNSRLRSVAAATPEVNDRHSNRNSNSSHDHRHPAATSATNVGARGSSRRSRRRRSGELGTTLAAERDAASRVGGARRSSRGIAGSSWSSERQRRVEQPPAELLASRRTRPLAPTSTCPLPQVTIIRSDSNSSFIPMDDSSAAAAGGSCSSLQQAPRSLVSRLADDGSVESGCAEWTGDPTTPSPQPPGASGERDQQESPALGSECKPKSKRASTELKRGLQDQLESGKVPPIHQRLLEPTGAGGGSGGAGMGGGLILADSMDNLASLIPRVRVEFYNSENTLKEQLQMYLIKDHTVSLYVRSAKLILKVLACYLYVCRVILDRGPSQANCYGCQSKAQTNLTVDATGQQHISKFDSHPYDGPINFRALLWVDRGPVIWSLQTGISVICFLEAILMQYLTYKNSIFSIISFHFTLELVTNTPFIVSIFWDELRTLFVPGFLNCWLAKQCLEAMLNDLSIVRQSSVFSHRLTILSATVFCLIFTSACGFQHTQRSGGRNYITIFESIYFVVVTFSTVGYGDFKPETWPSQLFIMVMICVALIVLPTQFEQLAYFWIERKKLGASYAHHSTRHEKHVVVCSTTLRADTIMDFLNEFYAHPLLQTFSVVLLSPCELDTTMKLVLQTPTWNNRVVYIQGSALKANDLIRARMQSAEACFILAARNYNDRSAADEHTILRSWAIRDFSPYVPQYVQIFRTENKIHVAFAEHVVCDDEFKYALLANNCLIPGTSTLVTLLLHTSQQQSRRHRSSGLFCFGAASGARRRKRKQSSSAGLQQSGGDEPSAGAANEASSSDEHEAGGGGAAAWKRLYGKCSANEIYHIRLSDSRFFGEYQGKSFTYASFHSHRKFGVALIGVQTDMRGTWPIMLNPGPSYVLKSGDILFYINITKEENSTLMPMMRQEKQQQHYSSSLSRRGNNTDADEPPAWLAKDPLVQPSGVPGVDDDAHVPPVDTCIRVETSSPTILPQHDPLAPSIQEPDQSLDAPGGYLLPARHSVADGAGIVGRSLCSVAGGVAAPELMRAKGAELPADSYLAAGLRLATKRNSSASAEATISHTHGAGGGLGSRNASTLELAALASGALRKGSNMSITSTKSRDVSGARIKQVVSGLAVRIKRAKLGKSLTHLTIPRMDYGGSSASSTESFVNARGRRPSIAPVPAMMGESEEHDSDHEREQESYFAMSWQSSSESSPIVKKFVFCTTYVGVSPTLCYMLQRKKPACCLQLVSACEHCPYKNARQYNWQNRCIILASDFASNGIYNFLVPLRAHFHNPTELRPIVLLLERKPSPQFIDAISWFPMVYWMPGSIDSLDDLIKAGINLAHSVVVTNKESTNSAEEDYLADCNTIVAVQTMFKMFPSVGIITELSQSSNMRFMQFRAHDLLFGGLSMAAAANQNHHQSSSSRHAQYMIGGSGGNTPGADNEQQQQQQGGESANTGSSIRDRSHLRRLHSQLYGKSMGKEVNSHAYKYRLPFAAGNVFSASMLDTLLYQAFVKDYMITMVRLLLGIDQAPGSGFLSSMRITKDELWIRTYGRLYQRLCSTTCEIPLGIYRTEPLESQRHESMSFGAFASQQASYEHATEELERIEISNMVKNRLQDLGMLVSDYDDSPANRNNTFSYVIINPNCDIQLREGDIIYLIRPSPIHSRKLFMHRANSVRHSDETTQQQAAPPKQHQQATTRNPMQQQHPGKGTAKNSVDQTQVYMKSCLSDGDFSEILIKVSDQESSVANSPAHEAPRLNGGDMQQVFANNDMTSDKSRRRSSCSDADEPIKQQHPRQQQSEPSV